MDFNKQLEQLFEQEEFKREYYRQAAFSRLSDQLLMLRKQRGLTQKDLSKKANTTQTVVSRLENGSVKPSLETIVKFAEALDAAAEVRLVPLEDIKPYEAIEKDYAEEEKKKKDLHEGVVFFGKEVAKSDAPGTWFESENIATHQFSSSLMKRKEKVFA
ncbi:MAG: helix-turn-helix domain-containing protein [Chloroflexota bacterium]